ncbi:DNA-binding NtrC family response regulator [Geothermobacter ehrlichii]|uniref:DNA-binding NtrC family response regulator n=2 Tax=Geothermobacter ehrlichii TaxID=213224 RepID=A0A5D3WQC5_9BACT|nr:DNA-binding NtrC family response regulator [Geothermobacter ehrlichii]
MERILFAWVGMNDLKASRGEADGQMGPIARVATEMTFSRLVLLDNYGPAENVADYVAWLERQCGLPVELVSVELPSPVDFAAIYVAARDQVDKVLTQERMERREVVPVFHLSPGTPAMAAVWILLAKGPFAEAELVQASREKGVESVEMPFNIFAEYVPDTIAGADRRLMRLSAHYDLAAEPETHGIVGQSKIIRKLVIQARLVAARDVPVLLEGETGTGKELFARFIHRESRRSEKRFLAVNCGAIPRELFESEFFGYVRGAFSGANREHPGYFEQADGGTLFLDEIGELPADAQVKILRVLNDGVVRRIGDAKDRQVNVRIIAATNRNLLTEVSQGRFRSDLFYRLAVAVLRLPPLREREGDIHLLLEHMLTQVNRELGKEPGYKQKKFSINAKNIMLRHTWPGNAREMYNTVLRICVWCQEEVIQEEDVRQALLPGTTEDKNDILSQPLGGGFNIQELQAFLTSHYIRRALDEAGGNKRRAAALLGLKNYQTLNNWIAKYGVEV